MVVSWSWVADAVGCDVLQSCSSMCLLPGTSALCLDLRMVSSMIWRWHRPLGMKVCSHSCLSLAARPVVLTTYAIACTAFYVPRHSLCLCCCGLVSPSTRCKVG